MPLVIATLYPKPDKAQEAQAVFEKHLPAIHEEPGCLLYALHSAGTPDAPSLVMVESWATAEDSAAHGGGPNMAALGGDLRGLMSAAPQLTRLVPLGGGDPAKGRLPTESVHEPTATDGEPFIAIATVTPLPGHRETVGAALAQAVERSHAEDDGCILYALHETADGYVMVEKWASLDLARAHGAGPAFAELKDAWDGKLAVPLSVLRLTPVPAGAPSQGTL